MEVLILSERLSTDNILLRQPAGARGGSVSSLLPLGPGTPVRRAAPFARLCPPLHRRDHANCGTAARKAPVTGRLTGRPQPRRAGEAQLAVESRR